MQEYLLRHVGAEEALGGLLGSALQTGPDLPQFLQAQLIFPYLGGMQFVQALKQRGRRGGWTLVDLADRVRVPDSTEQILHPEKWVAVETPVRVRLRVRLGAGWRRATAGTWGEWQTRELLGGDDAAAAGWGGDRYELWQRARRLRRALPARATCSSCAGAGTRRAMRASSWRALRGAPVARSDGAAIDAPRRHRHARARPDRRVARRVRRAAEA